MNSEFYDGTPNETPTVRIGVHVLQVALVFPLNELELNTVFIIITVHNVV